MTDKKDKTASANAALDDAVLDGISGGVTAQAENFTSPYAIPGPSSVNFTSQYSVGGQSTQTTENTAGADAQSDTASQASAPGIMPWSVP